MSVSQVKLKAFVVSALMSAVAGALFVGQYKGGVSETSFLPLGSLAIVAASVMVGCQKPLLRSDAGPFECPRTRTVQTEPLGHPVPADVVRHRCHLSVVEGRRRYFVHVPMAHSSPFHIATARGSPGNCRRAVRRCVHVDRASDSWLWCSVRRARRTRRCRSRCARDKRKDLETT